MNYETERKEILKRHAAELAEFESEALQHVLDNLTQESEEVWEHEIAHLQNALAKAEG